MIPSQVVTAARYGYFAHRFELASPGFHEELFSSDIVRAYTWATRKLPCLACGNWEQTTPLEFKPYSRPSITLVKWSVPLNRTHPWGPFPWRYPDGSTCYPRKGIGWVWSPELSTALSIWPETCFKLKDTWTYFPGCTHDPWAPLLTFLEASNSFALLKRILNAIPGKLAQSRPDPGPYFDPIAAGLVTSVVRGRMLGELILSGSHAVACVADAIWTDRPLESDTGPNPGDWRSSQYHNALCVQPGLFFSDNNIIAAQGTPARALANFGPKFGKEWDSLGLEAKIEIPYDHFIGPKEGLASGLPIGIWKRSRHTVRFDPLRKRESWDGKAIACGDSFHVRTLPPSQPDPDYFYLAPERSPEIIDGVPMSSPYWLDDEHWECLAGEPELWPDSSDELVEP